jgi:hypothetical protein
MSEQLWIQIIIYGGTLLIASLRFGFLVGRIENNCATKQDLKDKVKERDEKINLVFRRVDEHKGDCDKTYVRKDIAEREDQHRKEEISRLDTDAKNFRHEMMGTVSKIYMTLDALNHKVEEIKDSNSRVFDELKELILKR